MSLESAKKHLAEWGEEIIEHPVSSATVELAAQAIGVEEGQIAKTLSFRNEESAILVVTAGDVKVSNKLFKIEFGVKAKMLSAEEVIHFTGHPIGGVCPFGLSHDLPIYLDMSLKKYSIIYPAGGSQNSSVKLTPNRLEEITCCKKWVAVTVEN